MTQADALIAETELRRDVQGVSQTAHTNPQIVSLAARAVATVEAVVPPTGAEPYRSEFRRLYHERSRIAQDFSDALAAAGPFRFCLNPPSPDLAQYCAAVRRAQDAHDSRLSAWRRELADLRSRYNGWRLTQGR